MEQKKKMGLKTIISSSLKINRDDYDLSLMKNDFRQFCKEYNINYKIAKEIGIQKCLKNLEKYFKVKFHEKITKEDYIDLFLLVENPSIYPALKLYEILRELIKIILKNKIKRKIKKVLIIGGDLNNAYDQLKEEFPSAQVIIRSILEKDLRTNNESLDIFSGRALNNFALRYDKFDIVILSGLNSKTPSQKLKKLSLKFICMHLLQYNGVLCIIEREQDSKLDNYTIFYRYIKPIFFKTVRTKPQKDPSQLAFYIRYSPSDNIND